MVPYLESTTTRVDDRESVGLDEVNYWVPADRPEAFTDHLTDQFRRVRAGFPRFSKTVTLAAPAYRVVCGPTITLQVLGPLPRILYIGM